MKVVKIRNICDKTFLPIEEEITIYNDEIIGVVMHDPNNSKNVHSHLDFFVYKVVKIEEVENLYHVHCRFDDFDRIISVGKDYLKYIQYYKDLKPIEVLNLPIINTIRKWMKR